MHAPRRRTLRLAVLLAFTLLTTTAAAVFIRRALACPIEIPPQTLRTLYKHSDRIVVARVGHTELVERDEDSSQVRTALHVARNVKGKDEGPVVFVHHTTWAEDGVEKPGTYKQGEQLLVFLERIEEEEEGRAGYTVDNADFGVKKLSDDDLKVYLARIDELAGIEGRQPPDKAALVEWLVRCAEEPATRWEGAYELMVSAGALESLKEQKENPPSEAEIIASVDKHHATVEAYEANVARALAARGEAVAPAPSLAAEQAPPPDAALGPNEVKVDERLPLELRRAVARDPSLAGALTEEQKRRLADALFGAEKIGEGEGALLHVVKGFRDARLVPFLVAQLRRVEDNPPIEAEEWLAVLSEVMNNEEAVEIITSYSANVTYYEEEETAGEESAETAEAGAADEAESNEADEEADQKEMEAREAAATERATKKRSAMLKDLLARVERILASPQVAVK